MNKTKNNPIDRFRHSKPRFHEPPKPEFHNAKDSGRCKRTKSSSPEKDGHRSFRQEDSCTQLESANDPKTSEYAFFKKLKKDAGLRFNSHPVQKDDSLTKEPEQTKHSRERNDDIRIGSKCFNALRTAEGISTDKTDKFFSTPDGNNNSDFHSPSGIQKNSQGCSDTFKPQALVLHEGNQNVHGNIFSRKRQKLRQCIADTLFPNNKEKFSLKGHDDIVSMLLGRLFPVRIEENKYEDRNQWKEVDTTGYDFHDSKESDLYKELDQMPSRKLVEQSSSYFSDNLLSPMLLSSDERIATHHAFPPSNSHMFQLPYSAKKQEYKLDIIPSFSTKHDTTLEFPYSEGTNDAGYGLIDSQKSDVQFKEHNQVPETRLLELEPNPCIRDYSMPPIFLRSNNRIFPEDFPTSHSHKFRRHCNTAEPEGKFDIIPSFSDKYDGAFGFPYNEETDAIGYGLLDFQKSDFQLNYQIPEPRLLEFEPKPCIRNHLSPIFVRSNENGIQQDFPTSHSHTFQPMYTMKEYECDLGRVPSFSAKDVAHKFLLNEQEHDTFALSHYKEQGRLKREPIPLLLENGFDCPADEINSPIACTSPKPDLVPALSTLGKGEKQMLMNTLGECHFNPSSLLFDKPQNISSILDSGLFRYQEFRFKEGNMDSNFNHDVLPISHNKRHFTWSADCKNDINSHDQDRVLLQPYDHWIRQTAYNGYHRNNSDAEAWLSSSFNFISGQNLGLSLTSSHSTCRGSNSSNLELPQRESMCSPFQISDNSEPEMDDENHREVLYRFRHSLFEICNSSFSPYVHAKRK